MTTFALARRLRRLAAIPVLAAAAALAISAAPAGAIAPTPQTVEETVDTLLESEGGLEEFWTQELGEQGITFTAPTVHFYDSGTGANLQTGCGSSADQPDNAFYCTKDGQIYADRKWMQELFDQHGDYAVAGVLAHEYGHFVDHVLQNQNAFGTFKSEYHADCLAGISTGYGYDTGLLDDSDYFELMDWYLAMATSKSHGFAAERLGWYTYGFQTGDLEACGEVLRQ
jgi:predicted metalloprotease